MAGKVKFAADHVLQLTEAANDEILAELAFEGEGLAKVNASVDTGFMRNAIYGLAPGQSHRGAALAEARAVAERELAGMPVIGEHEAAIHGAAEYTAYQEARIGFMYRALKQLTQITPSVIRRVGRERFG